MSDSVDTTLVEGALVESAETSAPDPPPEPTKPAPDQRAAVPQDLKRFRTEARKALKEAQDLHASLLERGRRIEDRERQLADFEAELAKDPMGALRKRYQITPESLLSFRADEAGKPDALLSDRIGRLEERLVHELKTRDDKAKAFDERSAAIKQQGAIDEDVRGLVTPEGGDERFPNWMRLHPKLREKLARQDVLRRVYLHGNGEDVDTDFESVLADLDDEAKIYVVGSSEQAAPKLSATASKSTARGAASPAARRPLTDEELRENARKIARQELGR